MPHQTNISRLFTKDYAKLLDQCVHCGLCLEACPTYSIFRTEMESPRGRITLMRAAAGGLLDEHAMKISFKDHLSLCLVCLACEPACPSGVQYGKLATITRGTLEEISTKNISGKIISWLGQKQFLPHIGRLKLLALVSWVYQISGLQKFFRRTKALPKGLQAAENLLPNISLQYPKYGQYESLEKPQGKVAFFHGCVQEAFLPHINQATVDVLQRNGFEVCTPATQTCCGAAQLHSGQYEFARQLARQNIDAFILLDSDAIITNAGGCGYTLKDYPTLLKDDPDYYPKALSFADKVKDFSEFLFENLHENPPGEIRKRVVYLDSCHLRHGQNISSQPRSLLKTIPALDLVELKNPDRCCGSAGVYNLSYPDISDSLLNEKIADIAKSDASVVITSNTGCHLQILAGIRRAGLDIKVMHLSEILELSYANREIVAPDTTKALKLQEMHDETERDWLAWQYRRRKRQSPPSQFQQLQKQLRVGQIIFDPVEMMVYEQDASVEKGSPSAVVFPYDYEDVQKVMRWAKETGIPILPRGSGTSLAGSAVAEKGDLILEFSHMASIFNFDPVGRSLVIQPGAVVQKIGEFAEANGYYYPPDPASGRSSTLGGTISTNAGGPHCFKYGVTSNYVMSLEVILADGCKIRLGGQALDYPEFDLIGLLTGNEGTLGIITEATIRMVGNPPAHKTMMAAFESIEQAGQAVSEVIAKGYIPATMEMLDQEFIRTIEAYTHIGLPVEAGAIIIVEVDGYAESVTPQMKAICELLESHGAYKTHIAQTEDERTLLWHSRKSAAGSIARIAPYTYNADGTIPRSKLAECIRRINQISRDLNLRYGYIAHVGDGNLHPNFFILDPEDKEFMQRVTEGAQRLSECFVELGGTITGEHGVGIEKREHMSVMYSDQEIAVMREIKTIFDPEGLLNPGKIFPTKIAPATPIQTQPEQLLSTEIPETQEEASAMIRSWYQEECSIGIVGAGTKSRNVSHPKRVLSTSNLRGIQSLALEELSITVQSGTTLNELNTTLAKHGMKIPLGSPWPQASMGGIISTNFNAPLRMRYGSIRDLVQALKVVLPDGRMIRTGRPLMKNVAGYDLTKLFIGAWGTLGLITEISLKLSPQPGTSMTFGIPIENIPQGIKLGELLLRSALVASSILICHGVKIPGCDSEDILLYTAEGHVEDVQSEMGLVYESVLQSGGAGPLQLETSGTGIWNLWMADHLQNQYLLRIGIPPKESWNFISDQSQLLMENSQMLIDLPNGHIYLKTSQGIFDLRKAAIQRGGYVVVIKDTSCPHADVDPWGYMPESIDMMRSIKKQWDPKWLFNLNEFIL